MTTSKNMENHPSVEGYRTETAKLLAAHSENFIKFHSDLNSFWARWQALHVKILEHMLVQIIQTNGQDSSADSKKVEEFLKKRNALLSVLIQHLQKEKIFDTTRQTFAILMRQHDEIFRHILQSAQNEMRRELKKAFAASTAVKGYAKTSTFGG